jgi:hypothetical protein
MSSLGVQALARRRFVEHVHVLVYTSDHADPQALAHDYVGLDHNEVDALIEDLLRSYSDAVGAQTGLGTLDDVREAGAVTVWPQDRTWTPLHIVLCSCLERHDLCRTGSATAEQTTTSAESVRQR